MIFLYCSWKNTEKTERRSKALKKRLNTADIWATSQENLFMPYVNNKDADQPAYPRVWSAPLLFASWIV